MSILRHVALVSRDSVGVEGAGRGAEEAAEEQPRVAGAGGRAERAAGPARREGRGPSPGCYSGKVVFVGEGSLLLKG